MKKKKAISKIDRRTSNGGTDGANSSQVAAEKPDRRWVFREPKTELEQAIRRYVDLFEFAPIGYVTFDRVGRIEEINFAAVRLLGRSRKQLIGITFAVCVAKDDTQRFLNHLLECRTSDRPVVTELHLKQQNGEKIPVQLSSTTSFGLMKDGASLYQTAIVDLTQRKRAEEALAEGARQQGALYEFSRRCQTATSSDEIHQAALDAILTAQWCDRASILLYDQRQVMRFVAWRGLSKDYRKAVEGQHPRFKRPYTECVYQPMLELMQYLRANGFKTYIVTGGGQEFVRAFAEEVYGVPPEQVIGSMGKLKYEYNKDGSPELIKLPEVLLIDDKTGKPEGINMVIGRRPYGAFGNSTGDQQMLEYTGAGDGARLMMLVHHDDAKREYAYGADSKIGTFSDTLMAEAKKKGWIVISMKDDWKTIFPPTK
jgi:PAS domain S-box-containing protein